jgi:hypothetical protein
MPKSRFVEVHCKRLFLRGHELWPVVDEPDAGPMEVPEIADSEAKTIAELKDDFNALLAALRDMGLIL